MAVRLAGGIGMLCPLERFSAIPADYIDLARCPDKCTAAGADIFDTAVGGFLAPTLGGSLYGLAAGIDFVLAYGFNDPCLGFRGQCCYYPAINSETSDIIPEILLRTKRAFLIFAAFSYLHKAIIPNIRAITVKMPVSIGAKFAYPIKLKSKYE